MWPVCPLLLGICPPTPVIAIRPMQVESFGWVTGTPMQITLQFKHDATSRLQHVAIAPPPRRLHRLRNLHCTHATFLQLPLFHRSRVEVRGENASQRQYVADKGHEAAEPFLIHIAAEMINRVLLLRSWPGGKTMQDQRVLCSTV